MDFSSIVSKKVSFWDMPINKQARISFNELLAKCNFSYSVLNNKLEVKNIRDELVGYFLVTGGNVEDKILSFDAKEINGTLENDYVAVVVYKEGQAQNVFLFKCSDVLLGKNHRYFKNSPKLGLVGIKIKRFKSRAFQKQKFGVILNNFIK